MTVEQSPLSHFSNQPDPTDNNIDKIKEVTGIKDRKQIAQAIRACQNERGAYDVTEVINYLIREPDTPIPTQVTDIEKDNKPQVVANPGAKSPSNNGDTADLQKAIAASLQEQPGILGGQVTKEEQDISRILEASLEESKVGTKRKRGELWFVDPLNPHERKRQEGWPVGLKNVGNTCWFSAVIQSLFHLPMFRHLVLNFSPPPDISQGPSHSEGRRNLKFMQELRRLFALLTGSKRKYVDPSKAVDILKEAFCGTSAVHNAQQDVSEFQHKLLEWMEDAFQTNCRPTSPPDGASSGDHDAKSRNPMVQLFYGQVLSEGLMEGNLFSNKETFGQFPLQVEGQTDIHESLENAMAQEVIEGTNRDGKSNSGFEQWFTRLPPVLTFELSRFQFNQQLGRPEKIHNRLAFPETVYMDRYMQGNRNTTRQRREEVRKLRSQLQQLRARLDKFMHYGSGPVSKRVPLHDVLQYALEFAESKPSGQSPPKSPPDVEMESPQTHTQMVTDSPVASPSSQVSADVHMPEPSTSLVPPVTPTKRLALMPSEPAPKYVSSQELQVLQACLKRWRTEVESDVKELQDNITRLEDRVNTMYSDESMCKHPYRLHAVLVHEGQAASGHYWAYVYSCEHGKWLKFNDITVTEASWEELEKESVGGYHNASAYCLMYVDASCKGLRTGIVESDLGQQKLGSRKLPLELENFVEEDNSKFAQEIADWDSEQRRKQQVVPSTSSDPDITIIGEQQPVRDLKVSRFGPQTQHPYSPQAEMHARLAAADTMKAVEDAISSETNEKQVFHNTLNIMWKAELKRLEMMSEEICKRTQGDDPRINSIMMYLVLNKAPKQIVERALWEQFALLHELDNKHSTKKIRHMAMTKLETAKNVAQEAGENLYRKWHEDFSLFRRTVHDFVIGLKLFHKDKFREALPYLDLACDKNRHLCSHDDTWKGLDNKLLHCYRRQCLLHLNEVAVQQFERVSSVTDLFEMMDELVLPCLTEMAGSEVMEDQTALEDIRDKWCHLLANDIPGEKGEKLQDFLSKLFEPPADVRLVTPAPTNKTQPGTALYDEYREAIKQARSHGYLEVAQKEDS